MMAGLFIYSYEAEFIEKHIKDNIITVQKPLISLSCILMIFYQFNYHILCQLDSIIIPPKKPKIQEATATASSASFLDIISNLTPRVNYQKTLNDKSDEFNFAIINVPHLESNLPTTSAYGVYIS